MAKVAPTSSTYCLSLDAAPFILDTSTDNSRRLISPSVVSEHFKGLPLAIWMCFFRKIEIRYG